MKKRYLVVPVAFALLFGIYASSSELPEGFDKNKVFRMAKLFLRQFNAGNYAACYQQLSEEMQNATGDIRLRRTFDAVTESLGKFVLIKGISALSKTIDGEDYAVCTIKGQYEKRDATLEITLNKALKISNLSIK